jgi:integrase
MGARLAKGRKRAAMGVYRRKSTWWISYHDQYRRRVQESSHSSIRRDAERLHALRKSEVLRGVYRQPVQISLKDFAERYMEYAKTNKRSWLRDEQLLKPLKEYLNPESQLADITPPEIEGYKVHRRRKVSGATVNRELALLKHMFNLAIDWDMYTGSNPLRKVKYFQEINTGFRVLKPDEETRLLRNATPAIQDIVLYALNTGSRIGEIFSLRWQDVDLDQGMINSFSHKTQKIRIVPINAEVRRILEFWKLGRKNEYVFYNQKTGERFVDLDAGLELACKKAEIEGVTWHTLRHTFASRLLERGADIITVKELLGHSTVTVTMRYTHSNLASKVAAVGKLAGTATNLLHLAPKCNSKGSECSKVAANALNVLELKTEGWVSG